MTQHPQFVLRGSAAGSVDFQSLKSLGERRLIVIAHTPSDFSGVSLSTVPVGVCRRFWIFSAGVEVGAVTLTRDWEIRTSQLLCQHMKENAIRDHAPAGRRRQSRDVDGTRQAISVLLIVVWWRCGCERRGALRWTGCPSCGGDGWAVAGCGTGPPDPSGRCAARVHGSDSTQPAAQRYRGDRRHGLASASEQHRRPANACRAGAVLWLVGESKARWLACSASWTGWTIC